MNKDSVAESFQSLPLNPKSQNFGGLTALRDEIQWYASRKNRAKFWRIDNPNQVVPRSFPAVTFEPAALISSFFTESAPLSFSLLRRPNLSPERLVSLWTPMRLPEACGGAWVTVAVMHWVPVQSPICHERVGVFGLEFGYRLSLERILPIVQFPDLIRRRRAVMTTQSSEPPAQPTSAATVPALMDHLAVGPTGSQVPASLASSVAQPVSARRRHRPASTTDTTSTDALRSQLGGCRSASDLHLHFGIGSPPPSFLQFLYVWNKLRRFFEFSV
ncbi:hypothetical protein L3X38_036297 [Prunus dulcis]|uniref:Uncharacterized protein n=1 Tax=Prunus dulcis TaxID=3755 RepID=A0AAD4V0Z2_PRUDU|nr:hypothetical protein L3X38_036297 [Prunus dulcis]